VVDALLFAPVLSRFVHAAATFALAGGIVWDGGILCVTFVLGRRGGTCGGRTG
jgi:hypothetical protein